MSYKTELRTGSDPKWYSNALRFATREEADSYGLHKAMTWTAVADFRVAESDDPVNYRWDENGLTAL